MLTRRHFLASLTAVLAALRILPAPGAGVSASAPGPASAGEGVFTTSTVGTTEMNLVDEDIHGVFLSPEGYFEKVSFRPARTDLSSWIPGPRRDGLHPDSNILGPGPGTS